MNPDSVLFGSPLWSFNRLLDDIGYRYPVVICCQGRSSCSACATADTRQAALEWMIGHSGMHAEGTTEFGLWLSDAPGQML
jgi:hypothetical protein